MDSSTKKPTWLQILEAESWQAELIISGIAIFGSLQLPGLLGSGIDWVLVTFDEAYQAPFYFIFWYLAIVSVALIVNFILHFCMRAFWIGSIGLSSVFPHGIKADSGLFSSHYMRQMVEEFPDIDDFNQRLDQKCSLVFALSFIIIIAILTVTFYLLLLMLVLGIIRQFVPSMPFTTIYTVLILLLILPAFLSGLLNIRALRERQWVKRIHFPFFVKRYARATFSILYEPYHYLVMTFATNYRPRQIGLIFGIYFASIMILAVPVFIQTNAMYLQKDIFHARGKRADKIYAVNYEDRLSDGQAILQPTIPSESISDDRMRLFIPLIQRELPNYIEHCGEADLADSLQPFERRRQMRQYRLDCLKS
ncbi:MAG: hypothetical protein R3350_00860, partial [Saprospiraceae bacterium]|nr:hypothetical protein [Saprospiraceae bacterium]